MNILYLRKPSQKPSEGEKEQAGDQIFVSSNDLPEEGSTTTVKGVIKRGIFGISFYLDAKPS